MKEPIKITGRGKLVAEAKVESEAVVIRIDDEARPEFWAEVRLTSAQLETLLEEIELKCGEEAADALSVEVYEHDECSICHVPSVPAEGVPDQALRGCPRCHDTWMEDCQ